MSGTDATIRFRTTGADAAGQEADNLRQKMNKGGKDAIEALETQIKLIKEKNKLEDDLAKRQHTNSRQNISEQQRQYQEWMMMRERNVQFIEDPAKRKAYASETTNKSMRMRTDIIEDQRQLDKDKQKTELEKQDRLKQLRTTQEQLDEAKKTRKVTEDLPSNIARFGTSAAQGNVGGMLSSIGGKAGMITLVAAAAGALMVGAEAGLRQYATINQASPLIAGSKAYSQYGGFFSAGVEDILNMTAKEFGETKVTPFSYARGKNLSGAEDASGVINLAAAEIAKGLRQGQVESLLGVERYSGKNAGGTIANFEDYLMKSSKALLQLPEILQSYLGVANGILSRTGVLNAGGLQQFMTSIGGSYKVEGQNLDRMTAGLTATGQMSKNPVMLDMQLRTLRKMYPNKSMWELRGIMEHASENPQYVSNLLEQMKTSGGGGDWAKFQMLSLGNLGWDDINKVSGNKLNLDKRTEAATPDYTGESAKIVGVTGPVGKQFLEIAQMTGRGLLNILDVLENKLPAIISKSTENGMTKAIQNNKTTFQGRP